MYLNGQPVYHVRVDVNTGSDTPKITRALTPPAFDEVVLDPVSLEEGENILALLVLTTEDQSDDFLFEPRLDAWSPPGRPVSDTAPLRKLLERSSTQPDKLPVPRAPELLAYFEARILEAEGKLSEALPFYRAALERNKARSLAAPAAPTKEPDPTLWRPEPILSLTRCLGKMGNAKQAELELRTALSSKDWGWRAPLWDEWLRLCFADRKLSASEMLEILPNPPQEGHVRPVDRQDDAIWLLKTLDAPQPFLSINCGGERCRGSESKRELWGADRFFLGGTPHCVVRYYDKREVPELYGHWARGFGETLVNPAYRIPLPLGHYSVSLHVSLLENHQGQEWVPPQFYVRLENRGAGKTVVTSAGDKGTSRDLEFLGVSVQDGALDIDLVCQKGEVLLSGIEIKKLKG